MARTVSMSTMSAMTEASGLSLGQPLNSMPARLRSLTGKPKPDIKIKLDGARSSGVQAYSTHDSIEGTVAITAPIDTRFENIEIDFIGRTDAFHQFLKLSQPLAESDYPELGVLVAGRTYNFKFLFVVPEQTLPRICRHKVAHPSVHQAHIQLPPSLGDQEIAGRGDELLDDLTPHMASVRYAVAATVSELKDDGSKHTIVVQVQKVRIVPATDEQPPVPVDNVDGDYSMRCEKSIKKGVFKGKLGTLVMEAAQPKSLRLPPPNVSVETPATTMVTAMLRFDPADSTSQPPKLGNLSSKLKINTFFATSACGIFPVKRRIAFELNQGIYTEAISLPARCVAGVEWTRHSDAASEQLSRRDSFSMSRSMSSTHAVPLPSKHYQHTGFYTAEILIPVSLPSNKSFVPTFHSCLISRTYGLTLQLGISGAGIGPSMELKIPVQVSSEGTVGAQPVRRGTLTSIEEVLEEREADAFFRSRTLSVPSEHLVGGSSLFGAGQSGGQDLPPDYDAFPRTGLRVPVAG